MKTSERLLNASKTIWDAYNEHPFVLGIQNGTLERDKFRYYIMQDFLYLKDYAKTYAVGVAKAKSVETANLFAKYINVMNGELDVHKGYMGKFAVTQEEIDAMKPSLDNLSYTSYMVRVAYDESEVEVLAAVLSCAYSYEVIAKKIVANRPESVDDPFYGDWIRGYASDEYAAGNVILIETLDRLSAHYTEEQLRHLEDIFIACTDNLTGFSAAIEAVFPKTEIQNCIIHQLRNSSKYVSYTHLLLHNFVKHSRNNKDVSALFADSTVLHPHSPPCPPCHPRIVRHEQQRRPLISQFCQNIHNLRTAAAIKISRRFVRQNDGRVVDERTRNRHTLLLSAGKLVRIRLHLIQHTDFAQHFRRTRQTLLLRHARVTQRERHVFRHGVGGKEVEGLEDIPEGLEAQSGFCLVGEVANVLTVEGIVSFGQIIEQTDDVEQRCFAAAGFAGDGDKFALLNVQADAGQRVDGAFAFSVDFLCF